MPMSKQHHTKTNSQKKNTCENKHEIYYYFVELLRVRFESSGAFEKMPFFILKKGRMIEQQDGIAT